MVHDGATLPRIRSVSLTDRLVEAVFVVLIYLLYVEFTAFIARDPAAIAARDLSSTGGDFLRQVSYLSVFVAVSALAIRKRGTSLLAAIPIPLAFLLAWCAVSASWSDDPDITLRRTVLEITLVCSVMLCIDMLGSQRALELWKWTLAAILIADWVSVALVAEAIHQPSDAEPSVVGSWRGIHSHKNLAGIIIASAATIFLYSWFARRNWKDMALFAAAVLFLIMTRSKTSMGLLPLSLAAGGLYAFTLRSGWNRYVVGVAVALILVMLSTAAALYWQDITNFLEDPQQITGRAAIWQAEMMYVKDHPLLGAGYGQFANPGVRSPIYPYVGLSWVASIGEGHNGYLELIVTIGLVGFMLALAALVVYPLMLLSRLPDTPKKVMLFTLLFFVILHNFVESDFLTGTAPSWGTLLLIIGMIFVSQREARGRHPEFGAAA